MLQNKLHVFVSRFTETLEQRLLKRRTRCPIIRLGKSNFSLSRINLIAGNVAPFMRLFSQATLISKLIGSMNYVRLRFHVCPRPKVFRVELMKIYVYFFYFFRTYTMWSHGVVSTLSANL